MSIEIGLALQICSNIEKVCFVIGREEGKWGYTIKLGTLLLVNGGCSALSRDEVIKEIRSFLESACQSDLPGTQAIRQRIFNDLMGDPALCTYTYVNRRVA